jgi:Phage late-transcription coactivator
MEPVMEDNFLTKQKFSKMVEQTTHTMNMSYMDAIIHLSAEHKIELEDIKRHLSNSIRDKIEAEARSLNYLPKENQLPL